MDGLHDPFADAIDEGLSQRSPAVSFYFYPDWDAIEIESEALANSLGLEPEIAAKIINELAMFTSLVGVDRGQKRLLGDSIERQVRLGVDLLDLAERIGHKLVEEHVV